MTDKANSVDDLVGEANHAQQQNDWPEALTRWEKMRRRFPDNPLGYASAGTVLQHLGRYDEADVVLTMALERFPMQMQVAVEYARVAHRRYDWPEALRRWKEVMTRFPENADGIAGAGAALQQLGFLDEADALLMPAQERMQGQPSIGIEYARVAHLRRDWPEALRRWEQMIARFPENPDGAAGAGTALQELARFDEADTMLAHAIHHFPTHSQIAVEYARVAHRRGNWSEALSRWEQVIAHFPKNADGVTGAGVALQQLRRFDEWEELLTVAVKQFPEHVSLVVEHARAAQQRRDWPEALRRWEAGRAKFPNSQIILEGLGSSLFHTQIDSIDKNQESETNSIKNAEKLLSSKQVEQRALMMKFESLGSGCEFGLVQRHFGAEPLGLLRWGAIPASFLASALDARFEGIGNTENVSLFELGDSKEYFFRDKIYHMEMHTFMPAVASDYERIFTQQCRRVRYLKNKLIEDLESLEKSSKIFVYKRHTGALLDSEAIALHKAIRRYGNHTLLCMQPEDSSHPNGTVNICAEGFLVAYIDGLSPTSNAQEIKYASWLEICTTAYHFWQERAEVDQAVNPIYGYKSPLGNSIAEY